MKIISTQVTGEEKPYDYQQNAVDTLNNHFESHHSALLVMATGLGKTLTVIFWLQKCLEKGLGKKILFLCHNNDILEQAKEAFDAFFRPNSNSAFLMVTKKTER